MSDTTEQIKKKQQEIIFSKTPSERFAIGSALIDFGFHMVENSIKQASPDISESKLREEVFKRCYSRFYNKEEILKITAGIRNYYQNK
jgi:hypothetical protein